MENKKRLDSLIVEIKNCSKSFASKMIAQGLVRVNGKVIKKSGFLAKENDQVEFIENLLNDMNEKKDFEIHEYKKIIPIIYEDEYIYVVNKPSGIITHPTNYEINNTLVNALKYLKKIDEKKFLIPYRYGIVHRLDKDTSGLLIVSKNQLSFEKFTELIHNKKITRKSF